MVKRKPPIVLVSILVLAVGAAGFMSMSNLKAQSSTPEPELAAQTPAPEQAAGPARPQTSAKEVQDKLDKTARPSKIETIAHATDDKPKVTNGKPIKFVPKPTENSTDGQWYAPESHLDPKK